MNAHGWIVPLWAYVAATILLPFWLKAVFTAKYRETFADRLLIGSLLHGVVWISILFDSGLGRDARMTLFSFHIFGTLFYATANRRAAHEGED